LVASDGYDHSLCPFGTSSLWNWWDCHFSNSLL